MFRFIFKKTLRRFSTSRNNCKNVVLCGASGGIGQPLSLLLKTSPLIKRLTLYDIQGTNGVAADLSHIDMPAKIADFEGDEKLREALNGAEIVVIVAGMARKPGMTRDDLFTVNANAVSTIICIIGEICPEACIAIVTNPINSMVPLAAEILKKSEVFDKNRLFGVTTLDVVRANAFVAAERGINPTTVNVPVIGGHAGNTILPLLSRTKPTFKFEDIEIKKITTRVQEGGNEILRAKKGKGTATLSMAYAANKFINSLCKALNGESGIIECSYVASEVCETSYFATPLLLGKNGIKENLGIGDVSDFEAELIKNAIPELKKNIEKGIQHSCKK